MQLNEQQTTHLKDLTEWFGKLPDSLRYQILQTGFNNMLFMAQQEEIQMAFLQQQFLQQNLLEQEGVEPSPQKEMQESSSSSEGEDQKIIIGRKNIGGKQDDDYFRKQIEEMTVGDHLLKTNETEFDETRIGCQCCKGFIRNCRGPVCIPVQLCICSQN